MFFFNGQAAEAAFRRSASAKPIPWELWEIRQSGMPFSAGNKVKNTL
jgi:hypothetical protein